MQKRKAGIVKGMTGGIAALFKSNGVTGLQGHGRLLGRGQGRIHRSRRQAQRAWRRPRDPRVRIGADNAQVRAHGWQAHRRFLGRARIRRSAGAAGRSSAPASSGWSSAASGSAWDPRSRCWKRWTISSRWRTGSLPPKALKQLRKQGLDIRLGAKVSGATVSGKEVNGRFTDAKGAQSTDVRPAGGGGRTPSFTQDLLGENTGVRARRARLHRGGRSLPHRRWPMSTRWATACAARCWRTRPRTKGVMVADLAAGRYGHVNYEAVPSVIYTAPEIAWVGSRSSRPRSRRKRPAAPSRSAPFRSSPVAGPARWKPPAGFVQDRRRRRQRPRAGRAHHRSDGRRADCRSGAGAGIRRELRGSAADHARASRPCRKRCTRRPWPPTSGRSIRSIASAARGDTL